RTGRDARRGDGRGARAGRRRRRGRRRGDRCDRALGLALPRAPARADLRAAIQTKQRIGSNRSPYLALNLSEAYCQFNLLSYLSLTRHRGSPCPLKGETVMHSATIRHKILTIPGLHNSGPTHWQSLWEHKFPGSERIELGRWDNPDKDEWIRQIDASIAAESEPVLVVAHSLGCHAFAHWF